MVAKMMVPLLGIILLGCGGKDPPGESDRSEVSRDGSRKGESS